MRVVLVCHHDIADMRARADAVAAELVVQSERGPPVVAVYAAGEAGLSLASLIAASLDLPPSRHDTRLAIDEGYDLEDHEPLAAVREEAWSALEALRSAHPEDSTLVLVTHEIAVRLIVSRAINIPLSELRRFHIDPGSLSSLLFRQQRPVLLAGLNETCHLETLSIG